MSELRRCQHCGSMASWDNDVGPEDAYLSEWVGCTQCTAKCANAEDWNRRVSPWRSLKDDPPGDDNRLILLRGRPERRGAEQSGIVPDIPGWDGVVHEFARASWSLTSRLTEWMEIPK